MSDIIYLPVSLGEAIDKLTILDIKYNKIHDSRKIDIKKEYDILYENLKKFIEKYNDLYNSMKKINLIIWKQMDILRDSNLNNENYIKLCKECVESNDIRFRIKNKINLVSNSELKEQKSYKINRLIIELNCKDNLNELFIKPIKYFSYIYDEIIINSKNNYNIIKDYFYYDNTILFNINLDNINYKEKFNFNEDNYELDEIYRIMNLNDDLINIYF
jgi:hypothetical protein